MFLNSKCNIYVRNVRLFPIVAHKPVGRWVINIRVFIRPNHKTAAFSGFNNQRASCQWIIEKKKNEHKVYIMSWKNGREKIHDFTVVWVGVFRFNKWYVFKMIMKNISFRLYYRFAQRPRFARTSQHAPTQLILIDCVQDKQLVLVLFFDNRPFRLYTHTTAWSI